MKRVTVRPGKSVVVSDEALARARAALTMFGVRREQLTQLASFKGDVTIGKDGRIRTGRHSPAVRRRASAAASEGDAGGLDTGQAAK